MKHALDNYKNWFFEELNKIGVSVDDRKYEDLCRYYDLVITRNEVMNLTAITEPSDFMVKHFLDSAYLGAVTDVSNQSIIDVGTGAGFPGIVLKILFSSANIVLLDSLRKRVDFLNEVIDDLQLSGIRAVHGRAEEFGQDSKYREQFDICVSRAVSDLTVLSELCLPFVKIGGNFISYKSVEAEEELESALNAITTFGGQKTDVKKYSLTHPVSGEEYNRHFVTIFKAVSTPSKYPRRPGIPAKKPVL